MKNCISCQKEKHVDEFHRDKSKKDGLAGKCKSCVSIYSRQYYVKNKSRIIKRAIEWAEANRDKHNKKCLLWAKRNKGSVNARTARRYAVKVRATPAWAAPDTDQYWLIKEIYSLAVLRSKMTGVKWEVDHYFPIRGKSVSGLHVPENLKVVLSSENRRKSNRIPVT